MHKLIIPKADIQSRMIDSKKCLKTIIGTANAKIVPSGSDFIVSLVDPRLATQDNGDDKFTLYKRAFSGRYREIWKAQSLKELYLHLAYLEIYAPPTSTSWPEMLALHCDPTEAKKDHNLKYKLTPHMHINAALDPFPDAHIALYLDTEASIYANITSFNAYLTRYALMLKDQFINNLGTDVGERIEKMKKI